MKKQNEATSSRGHKIPSRETPTARLIVFGSPNVTGRGCLARQKGRMKSKTTKAAGKASLDQLVGHPCEFRLETGTLCGAPAKWQTIASAKYVCGEHAKKWLALGFRLHRASQCAFFGDRCIKCIGIAGGYRKCPGRRVPNASGEGREV